MAIYLDNFVAIICYSKIGINIKINNEKIGIGLMFSILEINQRIFTFDLIMLIIIWGYNI